jgi:hypothetical protein
LYSYLPDGRHCHQPCETPRANRTEVCVGVSSAFEHESEHLNPSMVRGVRKMDICGCVSTERTLPTAAFEPDELLWPRVVRRAFDVTATHEHRSWSRTKK